MITKLITTPVHDALGITTISASTKAEACRIAQIDFASFLTDTDLLMLVLYCSHPSIGNQHMSLPIDDYRREAAENAQCLHQTPDQVVSLAREGYFCHKLHLLLEIGNYNSDYGAKLVPIFSFMLEHRDEYYLGDKFVSNIQRFLAKRDFVDGFTIIDQTNEICYIMPSIWRKQVA